MCTLFCYAEQRGCKQACIFFLWNIPQKIQFPFTFCTKKKNSLFTEYQHLCQHDYERKVRVVPIIFCPHAKQWSIFSEHSSHVIKCPQGKNVIPLLANSTFLHERHNLRSRNFWFCRAKSCTRSRNDALSVDTLPLAASSFSFWEMSTILLDRVGSPVSEELSATMTFLHERHNLRDRTFCRANCICRCVEEDCSRREA